MTHTIQLRKTRDGSTFTTLDIDDYEANNTTGIYKVLNISISNPAPEVLSHVPDVGESHIVNYKDGDRLAVVLLNVFSSGDANFDDPLDDIAELRRWGREAFNRELDGSTWPIQLYVKRESTSNATIHYVKGGWVDDSASHFRGDIVDKKEARDVVLNLWLSPYGIAENAITLKNKLFSSPHHVEDSDSDDLSDGWQLTGTPTAQSNITSWLIGSRSQQIVTDDSTTEGIRCDTVSMPQSVSIVAYVWIRAGATHDPITIQLTDGSSNNIDNVEYNPASPENYDKTAIGVNGQTWYRYVVAGINSAAADAILFVQRTTGNASIATTFRIDGCYMEQGTQTAPGAWMSTRAIDNRGDIQSTSQATENYLNYWDVWGVPGDAPALVKTRFDWTTTAANQNIMAVGKISDGDLLAADEIYWYDDNGLTVGSEADGTWTQPAAAGRTEGQYRRFTDDGGGNGDTDVHLVITDGDEARSLLHSPKRVMLLCRSSANDSTLQFRIGTNISWIGEVKTLVPSSSWIYYDLGVVNLRGLLPLSADDIASQFAYFDVLIGTNTASATVDVDALLFLPVEENIIFVLPSGYDFNPNTINTYIDGQYKYAISSDYPVTVARQGTLWTVEPGNIMSRYIWAVQEYDHVNDRVSGSHDPTIAASIELSIWPRTRHLLGTE